MKKNLLTLLFIFFTLNIFAQEYKIRPFQVSFFPPLSTNGLESGKIVNRTSLNIIAGYNAGVEGFEVGAVANIDRVYVKGVQMAGFTNLSLGNTEGAQFAGFLNYAGKGTATQFAGFMNLSESSTLQAAGFMNLTKQKSILLLAGFTNLADSTVGQISGFLNTSRNSMFQIAGFSNLSKNTNVQISGFLNVAKQVTGTQIGLINICDSIQGIPIGLINIVRKGYLREFELAGGEALHTSLAYKMGVPYFYTIFSVAKSYTPNFYWAYGVGFGTKKALPNNYAINIEAMCNALVDQYWRHDHLDLLCQLKPTFSKQFAPHFKVFVGPTVNLSIVGYQKDQDYTTHLPIPYTFYEHISGTGKGSTKLRGWIGATAGIRF